MVVLPEPDTPVTTVSRPLGMATSSGFTVWIRVGGQVDDAVCEQFVPFGAVPQLRLSLAGEERADLRGGVCFKGGDRPLGDHMAAVRRPPPAPFP